MPTYDYRCTDCGAEIEVTQAFTDDPLTECASCGGALKKKFGVPGISFKGSGFYKTDSRSSGTSSSSSSSSTTSTGTDSSTAGSGDSKPADGGSGSSSGSTSSSTSSDNGSSSTKKPASTSA